MKLLLENWRKYLAEGEAEHFPWLEEIKSVDPYELRNWMNSSDRFIQVGRGSFRGAYVPLEDQDYVIKVVGEPDKYKMQMNKDDFDTARRYPFIFPKAYAHADDFSWVVMENTSPLIYSEDMQKALDQSFPAEQEALMRKLLSPSRPEKGWWAQWNPADPFHIMRMIMASFRADREINEATTPKDADTAQELQDILAPVAGKTYHELSKAMHEFEIDKYEIGRGNIGFDKDYNFKIIDSSVFSSEWDDDEPEYFVDAERVGDEWKGR